jgi:hypothetical protein
LRITTEKAEMNTIRKRTLLAGAALALSIAACGDSDEKDVAEAPPAAPPAAL